MESQSLLVAQQIPVSNHKLHLGAVWEARRLVKFQVTVFYAGFQGHRAKRTASRPLVHVG